MLRYGEGMTDSDPTATIVAFLREVGIAVEQTELPDDGFLPAMIVRDGTLYFDPSRTPFHPGDLLHEAGHIAVTDPELRPTVCDFGTVETADGDELAAIAWSYAAALAAGVDPRLVFHDDGYRGGGGYIADNFATGHYFGVPMLQYYGLAARKDEGDAPYPAMKRWLR